MLNEALGAFADEIIKRRSTLMTVGSCAGTVATFIFTIAANKKAEKLKSEGKSQIPAYILPGGICLGTVVLNALNEHYNSSEKEILTAGMLALGKLYSDNRNATKEIVSEEDQKKISEKIAESKSELIPKEITDYHKGKELYYDDFSERFFYAKPEWVWESEQYAENLYSRTTFAGVNDFYESLNIRGIDEIEPKSEFKNFGWANWHTPNNCYGPIEGIGFYHTTAKFVDGREYIIIKMVHEPDLCFGW